MKPKVCVLRTDGTNCDRETRYAFDLVGGEAEIVHINSLIKGYDVVARKKVRLSDYDILALPGGFSHGDYIAAGRILACDLKTFLGEEMERFVSEGKPVIGICNGFQVLVKYDLLPGEVEEQTATLTYNDSGNFECRWVKLRSPDNKCMWTKGVESIDVPVAHGEGKFIASEEVIDGLFKGGQVVYHYVDDGKPTQEFPANPNGSVEAIAGICDESGLVFGLMPHPERYHDPMNHELASLQRILSRDYVSEADHGELLKIVGRLPEEGAGLQIFRNGVNYVLENLI